MYIDHADLPVEGGFDPGFVDGHLQFPDLGLDYLEMCGNFIIVLLCDGIVSKKVFQPLFIKLRKFFLLLQTFELCLKVGIIQAKKKVALFDLTSFFNIYFHDLPGKFTDNIYMLVGEDSTCYFQLVMEDFGRYYHSVYRYSWQKFSRQGFYRISCF